MPAPMPAARPRLLTLAYNEWETVLQLPYSFNDLLGIVQDWIKPPPDAELHLRIPLDFLSIHAARMVTGPYIYLTGENSYQIAVMGVQGTRVEIVGDAFNPPEPSPPPPPVLDMPGLFELELAPGQHVALDVTMNSDELDMSRTEGGTLIDGRFWGKLDIVHSGDTHTLEFSGTRHLGEDHVPDVIDSRVMSKLAEAAKPIKAKCHLTILTPVQQSCEIVLSFSQLWKLGVVWPPPEYLEKMKIKYAFKVHPGGFLENGERAFTTALYYEAIPDASRLEPAKLISPRNGFAMPSGVFITHLMDVLDQLGMSLHARTAFINNNISAFSAHKNIAYRFLSPEQVAAAVDITVTIESCLFNRIFLIFRGVNAEELGLFSGSREKQANMFNWEEIVGRSEPAKNPELFRVLETSVLEIT